MRKEDDDIPKTSKIDDSPFSKSINIEAIQQILNKNEYKDFFIHLCSPDNGDNDYLRIYLLFAAIEAGQWQVAKLLLKANYLILDPILNKGDKKENNKTQQFLQEEDSLVSKKIKCTLLRCIVGNQEQLLNEMISVIYPICKNDDEISHHLINLNIELNCVVSKVAEAVEEIVGDDKDFRSMTLENLYRIVHDFFKDFIVSKLISSRPQFAFIFDIKKGPMQKINSIKFNLKKMEEVKKLHDHYNDIHREYILEYSEIVDEIKKNKHTDKRKQLIQFYKRIKQNKEQLYKTWNLAQLFSGDKRFLKKFPLLFLESTLSVICHHPKTRVPFIFHLIQYSPYLYNVSGNIREPVKEFILSLLEYNEIRLDDRELQNLLLKKRDSLLLFLFIQRGMELYSDLVKDWRDEEGNTLLHQAIGQKQFSFARHLLANFEIDLLIQNKKGLLFFHLLRDIPKTEVIEYDEIENLLNVNSENPDGYELCLMTSAVRQLEEKKIYARVENDEIVYTFLDSANNPASNTITQETLMKIGFDKRVDMNNLDELRKLGPQILKVTSRRGDTTEVAKQRRKFLINLAEIIVYSNKLEEVSEKSKIELLKTKIELIFGKKFPFERVSENSIKIELNSLAKEIKRLVESAENRPSSDFVAFLDDTTALKEILVYIAVSYLTQDDYLLYEGLKNKLAQNWFSNQFPNLVTAFKRMEKRIIKDEKSLYARKGLQEKIIRDLRTQNNKGKEKIVKLEELNVQSEKKAKESDKKAKESAKKAKESDKKTEEVEKKNQTLEKENKKFKNIIQQADKEKRALRAELEALKRKRKAAPDNDNRKNNTTRITFFSGAPKDVSAPNQETEKEPKKEEESDEKRTCYIM